MSAVRRACVLFRGDTCVFGEREEHVLGLIKVWLRRTCRTASQSSPPPPPVDTCYTSQGSW